MRDLNFLIIGLFTILITSCGESQNGIEDRELSFAKNQLKYAEKQLGGLLDSSKIVYKNPRTIEKDSSIHFIDHQNFDWTEGFFPGTCWYLYEETKKDKWKQAAINFQNLFIDHKDLTSFHDLGFVFNCSFGNAYRLTEKLVYKEVLLDAAKSLAGRFNENIGSIKSWDVDKGWQAERGWEYPVIIDNMMNLELLFEASLLSGDDSFSQIAISHADKTLENHFRNDESSYHVIDYDSITGEVIGKYTAQGLADESSWARGQAWGLYGFTMCYRYTKDERYLTKAKKIADYILNSKEIPDDRIPYWDYNVKDKEKAYRDVSAAAITVSALIELNEYTHYKYKKEAYELLNSLSSSQYLAEIGTNKNFLLKHSVGSIPHNSEIDVPLNYADYYYLEALTRLKNYDSQ